jgi:hypothetical protein
MPSLQPVEAEGTQRSPSSSPCWLPLYLRKRRDPDSSHGNSPTGGNRGSHHVSRRLSRDGPERDAGRRHQTASEWSLEQALEPRDREQVPGALAGVAHLEVDAVEREPALAREERS